MKIFYLGLFFLISCRVLSQGEFNTWCFGTGGKVGFSSGQPVNLFPQSSSVGGASTVTFSDSTGALLFYTDGYYCFNRNDVVMPNGVNMGGTETSNHQTVIGDALSVTDSIYYLFYVKNLTSLTYSVIDLKLNHGLGDVTNKKNSIPGTDYVPAGVYGTRAGNLIDSWIIVRNSSSVNNFLSYRFSPTGLDLIPVISQSLLTFPEITSYGVGSIKVSANGTSLFCSYAGNNFNDTIEIRNFNPSTGQVTDGFLCKPKYNGYDLSVLWFEFSPDSRWVYFASGYANSDSGGTFQADARAQNQDQFNQSIMRVGPLTNTANFQSGPDFKIYVGSGSLDTLFVVENPNIRGTGCNLHSALGLVPGTYPEALPQQIQRYKAYINFSQVCFGDTTQFTTDIWPPADSIHWDFNDPASGVLNSSEFENPAHLFSAPGIYSISCFVRYIDNRSKTYFKTIEIFDIPSINSLPDTSVCNGDSIILDAGFCSGCNYEWKDLSDNSVVDTSQTYTATQSGDYLITIVNTHGCINSDTVHISIALTPQITTNPLSKTICNGESTNILPASTVGNTMYHWTASLTSGSVTGFTADSGLAINQILTGSGIVNYNIVPKVGNCVGDAVDFVVTVTPGDSVKVEVTANLNNICAGTSVTYTATPTGPGILSYQWKVNGINQGSNNAVYSYSPANGDVVNCIVSSSETVCVANNPATSNSVIMVVDPLVPVSVTVAPSQNNICQGTSVTFTATPSPLSGNHNYQWTVNGINSGTDQNTFIYSPNNNDVVKCNLNVSGLSCLTNNPDTSQPVIMIVNPVLTPDVTITALPVPPVCGNISVTFTAHPVNGGLTPAYQWFVNGNPAGTNLSYSFIPANNDLVVCSLNSSAQCLTINPVSSIPFQVPVITPPVVTYTLCTDSITTTNAKPIKLKGGIPLGGTYSGPGVNSVTGIFTPSLAGTGIKTITYSYTNAGLCFSSANCKVQIVNSSASICGIPFTDVRDNKSYKTILIGSQCWMADNLQYGIRIPKETHQRDNCIPEKYCPTANCNLQTANFYQWDELMQYTETPGQQGLCPPAWHVPTEAEWNTLFTNWTNSGFAASALKYSGFSGFNAILSGVTHQNVQYDYSNFATFYWSSTPHGPTKAWAHGMNDPDPSVSRYPSGRNNAFGVRCIKD